jgi:hypothetical protein
LQVCMRAEEEKMSELQVQTVQPQNKEESEVNAIQRQFGRMNPPSYQRNQCSNCRGFGHFSRECPSSLGPRLGSRFRIIGAATAGARDLPEEAVNGFHTLRGPLSPRGLPQIVPSIRNFWTGRNPPRGTHRRSRLVERTCQAQHIGVPRRETRRETEFRDALSLHNPLYASHRLGHLKPRPDPNFN